MANRLLTFARLARTVAERTLPERAHKFAPKRYTQPQLLGCLLVKEYLGLDNRTAQETLELSDGLRDALGLATVPDYSTLWRFAHDKATVEVVRRSDIAASALTETLELLKASGHDPPLGVPLVAIDSTGLFCGHASRYFEQRRSRSKSAPTYPARAYQKWAAALRPPAPNSSSLSSRSRARAGTTPTSRHWPELPWRPCPALRSSPTPGRRSEPRVLAISDRRPRTPRGPGADPGQDAALRSGSASAIPRRDGPSPRVRHARRGRGADDPADVPPAVARRDAARPPAAAGSVVKRKWGEAPNDRSALTARLPAMQERQALVRGLVYNLYRLVVLGVRPILATP